MCFHTLVQRETLEITLTGTSDDKAISFIQAEKLYYESVLIDDTELQKHIGNCLLLSTLYLFIQKYSKQTNTLKVYSF